MVITGYNCGYNCGLILWVYFGLIACDVQNKNVTTIRSLDPVWQRYEQRYFAKLLPLVVPLQYPKGPVVCVQIGDDSDVAILTPEYYQQQHDEFRRLGYTGVMNTLINPGAKGWWGHWSQADKVKLPNRSSTGDTFAGLEVSNDSQAICR